MKESFEKTIKSQYFKKQVKSLYAKTFTPLPSTAERPLHEAIMVSVYVSGWFLRNSKFVDRELIPIISKRHGNPLPCTSEDIEESLFEQFFLVDTQKAKRTSEGIVVERDDEICYERFANSLVTHCSMFRKSSPFLIISDIDFPKEKLPLRIWNSQDFAVNLVDIGTTAYDPDNSKYLYGMTFQVELSKFDEEKGEYAKFHEQYGEGKQCPGLYAQIEGRCSKRALLCFENECKHVMASVIRSLTLTGCIYPNDYTPPANTPTIENDGSLKMSTTIDMSKANAELVRPENKLNEEAPNKGSTYIDYVSMLGRYIDYYYLNPQKKDSLDRRLRNAMHLLVEADKQKHPSVTIALSFSAIEALVGSNKDNIVKELSENVATLLEPEASNRSGPIDKIKNLYKIRCKILHGEKIEFERGVEEQVRRLAAGCFQAIMDWMDCNKRMGQKHSKVPDLESEIKSARISGKQLVGISKNSRNWLPTITK